MPKRVASKQYMPFTKGLITEASSILFPDEATVDEDNFSISRLGYRERRLGLKTDSDGEWVKPTANYVCSAKVSVCDEVEETPICSNIFYDEDEYSSYLVTLSNTVNLNFGDAQDFTISFFIKPSEVFKPWDGDPAGTGTSWYLLGTKTGSGAYNYGFHIYFDAGRFVVKAEGSNIITWYDYTNADFADGAFITVSYDALSPIGKIYWSVNGVVHESNVTPNINLTTGDGFYAGTSSWISTYVGKIKEISVCDELLYTEDFTAPTY